MLKNLITAGSINLYMLYATEVTERQTVSIESDTCTNVTDHILIRAAHLQNLIKIARPTKKIHVHCGASPPRVRRNDAIGTLVNPAL